MTQSTASDIRYNPDKGVPLDWTLGTGVLPSGGVLNIPANPERNWFFVQNQGTGSVTIAYSTAHAQSGAAQTSLVSLGAAPVSGGMGGSDERTFNSYLPTGPITVTGTAGQQITVLEA